MKVRTKVWIEDNRGKVIFGGGREHMLEAIDRLGSMNKAAKALKMSYRGLWARIKSTENRVGVKLVATRAGGGKASGSSLTPTGKRFLKNYKLLENSVHQRADKEFDKIFREKKTKGK
ncbi:MAG: LysR family transcriptional regulator [Syntrophobacterales bacterium]|jgi:molybdate transport system regulatory protein